MPDDVACTVLDAYGEFFDLPVDEKRRWIDADLGADRGYKGLGALMSLSTITAEYVKLWAAVVVVVLSVVFAAVVTSLEQVAYARWAPDRAAR